MNEIIRCPRCGKEYYFQEIVMPQTIFPKIDRIIRADNGEIKEIVYDSTDTTETYFCDMCDAPLKIKSNIDFEVTIDSNLDFSENTFISKDDKN